MLLGDDLAVELVLVAFLFRQNPIAPLFEMRKPAFEPARLAAIEPHRAARQGREKPPVVADDHHGGAARVEVTFQPFDGRQIEMIGRLVEQQNIGGRHQHAGKRNAARLAARKPRRIFLSGKAELLEQIEGGMHIVGRPQSGLDIRQRRGKAGEIRLLRQVTHQRARLHEHRAAIRFDQTGRDLQQRRLARSVAPDQRHAFARRDRELGARQQRRAAERQCDIFELKERWGHAGLSRG
jgi:hypothetical protein